MPEENITKINRFILKNRIPAKDGVVCVDGRYDKEHSGMIARPGGNFKSILILLALMDKTRLTIGHSVDLGVNAVEKVGKVFNMHTDEHTDVKDLDSIGCGHIAKAANPDFAKGYGVKADDVKIALMYLRVKLEGRDYYNMANLKGHHKEEGVLIVTGKKYTVNHQDSKTGEMYFVYDKTRDLEFSKKVHKKLGIPQISWNDYQKMADKQLTATLHLLAKGLPIYELNIDRKEAKIKFIGNVT